MKLFLYHGGISPCTLNLALYFRESQLHVQAALLSEEGSPVPIELETGWTREPIWALWRLHVCRTCRESNHDFSV
jgi:hypothetical protein